MKQPYTAPKIESAGALRDVTLQNKDFIAPSDGVNFKGAPILGSI